MVPFEWRRVVRDSLRIESSKERSGLFFRNCGGRPGCARWIWRANLASRRLSSLLPLTARERPRRTRLGPRGHPFRFGNIGPAASKGTVPTTFKGHVPLGAIAAVTAATRRYRLFTRSVMRTFSVSAMIFNVCRVTLVSPRSISPT
jgi:hypothetical protein